VEYLVNKKASITARTKVCDQLVISPYNISTCSRSLVMRITKIINCSILSGSFPAKSVGDMSTRLKFKIEQHFNTKRTRENITTDKSGQKWLPLIFRKSISTTLLMKWTALPVNDNSINALPNSENNN